jgi:Sec-independent protein translocase protein TatA
MPPKAPLFREPAFVMEDFYERRAWVATACYIFFLVLALALMIGFYTAQDTVASDVVENPSLADYRELSKHPIRCECTNNTAQYADFIKFRGVQVSPCSWDSSTKLTEQAKFRLGAILKDEEKVSIQMKSKLLTVVDAFINDTCRVAKLVITQAEIAMYNYAFTSNELIGEDMLRQQFQSMSSAQINNAQRTIETFVELGRVMNNVNAPASISTIYGNTELVGTNLGEFVSTAYPAKHIKPNSVVASTDYDPLWLRLVGAESSSISTNDTLINALEVDLTAFLHSRSRSHVMNVLSQDKSLYVKFRLSDSDNIPLTQQCIEAKWTALRAIWPNRIEAATIACDRVWTQQAYNVVPREDAIPSLPVTITLTISPLTNAIVSGGNKLQSKFFEASLVRGVTQALGYDGDQAVVVELSSTANGLGTIAKVRVPLLYSKTAEVVVLNATAQTGVNGMITKAVLMGIQNLGVAATNSITITVASTVIQAAQRQLLQFSPSPSPSSTSQPQIYTLRITANGLNITAIAAATESARQNLAVEVFGDITNAWFSIIGNFPMSAAPGLGMFSVVSGSSVGVSYYMYNTTLYSTVVQSASRLNSSNLQAASKTTTVATQNGFLSSSSSFVSYSAMDYLLTAPATPSPPTPAAKTPAPTPVPPTPSPPTPAPIYVTPAPVKYTTDMYTLQIRINGLNKVALDQKDESSVQYFTEYLIGDFMGAVMTQYNSRMTAPPGSQSGYYDTPFNLTRPTSYKNAYSQSGPQVVLSLPIYFPEAKARRVDTAIVDLLRVSIAAIPPTALFTQIVTQYATSLQLVQSGSTLTYGGANVQDPNGPTSSPSPTSAGTTNKYRVTTSLPFNVLSSDPATVQRLLSAVESDLTSYVGSPVKVINSFNNGGSATFVVQVPSGDSSTAGKFAAFSSSYYTLSQLSSTYAQVISQSNVLVKATGGSNILQGEPDVPAAPTVTNPPMDSNSIQTVLQNLYGAERIVSQVDCTLDFNQIAVSDWQMTKDLYVGCTPYAALRNNRVFKSLLLDSAKTAFDHWNNIEQAFREAYVPNPVRTPQYYCNPNKVAYDKDVTCDLNTAAKNGYQDPQTLGGWETSLDYGKYYDKCKPTKCTYTHTRRRTGAEVVVIIAGLLGGFNTALTIIIGTIGGIVSTIRSRRKAAKAEAAAAAAAATKESTETKDDAKSKEPTTAEEIKKISDEPKKSEDTTTKASESTHPIN